MTTGQWLIVVAVAFVWGWLANAQPREIRTEMVKPVFTNVCVSDEFVGMFNEAAARAGRALSGKPQNKVPGGTAAP